MFDKTLSNDHLLTLRAAGATNGRATTVIPRGIAPNITPEAIASFENFLGLQKRSILTFELAFCFDINLQLNKFTTYSKLKN